MRGVRMNKKLGRRRGKIALSSALALAIAVFLASTAAVIWSVCTLLRSATRVTQSTGETVIEASPVQAIAPCSNLDSLTMGSWNVTTKSWVPSHCFYNEAVSFQYTSCLNNKTISFYGDSTLRNIVNETLKLAKVDDEIKLKTWGEGPHYIVGGGKMRGDSSRGEIKMYWTPSAYYQKPAEIPSRLDLDDVAVISIGVWDMVNSRVILIL